MIAIQCTSVISDSFISGVQYTRHDSQIHIPTAIILFLCKKRLHLDAEFVRFLVISRIVVIVNVTSSGRRG